MGNTIKIPMPLEPNGPGFKVVNAEQVAYRETSVADKLTTLQDSVTSLTQLLNGIPTFEITGIPESTVALNEEVSINLRVESENAAECRVLIKKQKVGLTKVQTSSVTCYPGQFYPITLDTPRELGTFRYTISVTNGTKRCGLKGTTGGSEADIVYETTFEVVCGTATLSLPAFERVNSSTIYSFGVENELSLDMNYTVAQSFNSYEFKVAMYKNGESIGTATCEKFTEATAINPGTTIKKQIIHPFNIATADTAAVFTLKITATAFDNKDAQIVTSIVERTFVLDLMVENSITHTLGAIKDNLTSNDYLTIQFTPKTNNTNFNNSVIKYVCGLYRKNGSTVETTPIKEVQVNAYNLKTSTVSFAKFIALDSALIGLNEGAIQTYLVKLYCVDPVFKDTHLTTEYELSIRKVADLSADYVKNGLVLSFDFSQNLEGDSTVIENNYTDNLAPNTAYFLNLLNTNVATAQENGEIITSDKRLTGETPVEEQTSYFTFKSGQGAILVDKTGQPVDPSKTFYTTNPEEVTPGYSFEIFLKSTFLGDYSAVSTSFGNDAEKIDSTNGVAISIGKCKSYANGEAVEASIRHGIWKHVTFVVERPSGEATKYKIYINGILSAVKAFTEESSASNSTPLTLNGIFAKASLDAGTASLNKSGTTSIKFVRYYNHALTDADILQNFKTIYTENAYKQVIEKRNSNTSSVNVFFIKNETTIRNRPESKVKGYIKFEDLNAITKKKPEDENDTDYTSKTHAVNCTMLYTYTNDAGEVVVTPYPNVDVFLQGTSSLKYPVKNYQIKVYSEKPEDQYGQVAGGKDSKKIEVYPPAKNVTTWTTPSYIYTLKCDYMEESHRNNTPTACYYQDHVLDAVINYCKDSEYYRANLGDGPSNATAVEAINNDVLYQDSTGSYSSYSPARRHVVTSDNGNIYPYRDAIDGCPCIVYYSDTPLTGEISTADDILALATSATCAGSFMFNVDKEGPQLGFELPTSDIQGSANISKAACIDNEKVKIDESGRIATDGKILLEHLPCISYEGATNDNFSAAAFMPYAVQRANYLKYTWDTAPETRTTINGVNGLYKYFKLRQVKVDPRGDFIYDLDNSGSTKPDDEWIIYFASDAGFGNETELNALTVNVNSAPALTGSEVEGQMCYYTDVTGDFTKSSAWKFTGGAWVKQSATAILKPVSGADETKQRISQVSFLAFIASYYHDRLPSVLNASTARAIHGCNTLAEHQDIYGKDEYDYINKTLEPRFTFVDDVAEKALTSAGYSTDGMNFSIIKDAINWAYECSVMLNGDETTKAEGRAKFRNEFTRYFSFEYCLAYFLQMMLFAQVDNAGKNAMFDTWGNGKLYPRPYDMDTQMGLNNSGTDRILVSAELNSIFSPQRGGTAVRNSMWATSSAPDHPRFISYNTTNSALWKTFALSFAEEIKGCYSYLRKNGVYNAEAIQDYVNSKTRDVIGETYYNQDAHNKYMYNPADTSYYYCVNGSREDRYFEFLSNRITFLDSYYGYTSLQDSANGQQGNMIMLRALPLEIGDYIILKPLSPMYVSVTAEPNTTTCLITPDDTYVDEIDKEIKLGSKFIFQMEAPDKNMYITGSDNLSDIAGLDSLTVSEIRLNNAKNMTDLVVTDAPALQSLTLVGNSNLKNLDLSGNPALKIQLDLRDCVNLKSVNISNSGITSLTLPENCDLTYLNCANCVGLKALSLKNMRNLTNDNLILTGCKSLTSLELENCPEIVSTTDMPFLVDTAEQLDKDKTLPALQKLTIKNCTNFSKLVLLQRNMHSFEFDFNEQGLTYLDLTGCYGNAFYLLDLNNCPALKTVKLSGIRSQDLPTDTNQVRLKASHRYTYLDLSNSQVNVVYTNQITQNTMDFTSVEFDSLKLSDNRRVTNIIGLNYTGNLQGMFKLCKALVTVEASRETNKGLRAVEGKNVDSMFEQCSVLETISGNLDFTYATSANSACRACPKLTRSSLETVINAFGKNPSVHPSVQSMSSFAYGSCVPGTELWVSLPKSVTNLSHAFYSAGITKVGSQLLKDCAALTNVNTMFGSCSQLTFVHSDLFKDCTTLSNVKECFRGCSKLGSDTATLENNILYNSLDIFPEENNIQVISFMFHGCTSLTNKEGIGDGKGDSDDRFANKFFTKLTELQKAIGVFYNTPNLRLYFKDAIFSFTNSQDNLTHIDAMFAYSGLLNIPSRLTNKELPSLKNARGVFSNIVPDGDGEGASREERFTRITTDFFVGATAIQHISDSTTVNASMSDFQLSGGSIPTYGGIFANIPNLLLETGCFSKLTDLQSANRAVFVGSISADYAATYEKYRDRSITNPNTYPSWESNASGTLIRYYPKVVNKGNSEEIKTDIDLFAPNLTSLTKVAYLFAGNPTIQSISNQFINSLQNVTDISGLFSNCVELTCETSEGNNLISITSNKTKLTTIALTFENCYKLMAPITDGATTVLTGTATDASVDTLNCRGMFYGSGITGTVPANLFEDCRDKVTNTSYMFAKCYNLERIGMGYATNYNIPYNYDGSEVEYYYERNKAVLTTYSTYEQFKTAMPEYFTSLVRDNWFGSGKQFDRYRNYLEQWFYTQSRYYPANLTYAADFSGQIITVETRDQLDVVNAGRYYVTEKGTNEGLWEKTAGENATITQIAGPLLGTTKRIYLLNNAQETLSITSIAEAEETVLLDQLAAGGYRPIGTTDTVLLSKNEYYSANNKYEIVQKGLLSDCIKLTNVTYMFAGCFKLTGCIPADIFAYSNNYRSITSIEGLFAGCSNLTLSATPVFKDDQRGMIISSSGTIGYDTTVNDSLSEEGGIKTLTDGGYYSKIYPTVVYNKDEDGKYSCIVVDNAEVDVGNYFIPKDWLAKLTAISNIKNAFHTVGIARDLHIDESGRISANDDGGTLGRLSTIDTSNFSSDQYLYSYLKLDNTTFNTTSSISNASGAFSNVYTLGATILTKDFLQSSKGVLSDISYIFRTATLRQVEKPFQGTANLTSVYDCFYALNTNYNLNASGYSGPRDDKLYKESDDGKPISWMTSPTGGTLKESVGPELWKYSRIKVEHRNNCLASLTSIPEKSTWFEYRYQEPGSSSMFRMSAIANPNTFRA